MEQEPPTLEILSAGGRSSSSLSNAVRTYCPTQKKKFRFFVFKEVGHQYLVLIFVVFWMERVFNFEEDKLRQLHL